MNTLHFRCLYWEPQCTRSHRRPQTPIHPEKNLPCHELLFVDIKRPGETERHLKN